MEQLETMEYYILQTQDILNSVYKNRKIILESVSGKQYTIYIVDGSSEELAEELFQKIKEKLNQSKLVRKIDK